MVIPRDMRTARKLPSLWYTVNGLIVALFTTAKSVTVSTVPCVRKCSIFTTMTRNIGSVS